MTARASVTAPLTQELHPARRQAREPVHVGHEARTRQLAQRLAGSRWDHVRLLVERPEKGARCRG